MRIARSARMRNILGASLIATALPLMAAAESSDSKAVAITGGSVEAITGGSVEAITGGSIFAITGGSVEAITGGSVEAITGGSVEAITGGSVEAITGGSVEAITGGSVEAITGGSIFAITGGSVEAITGGSVEAITGGSIFAITGGSVEAITGGSVEAITGGSVEAITGGSIFAITGGSVEAITGGSVEAITGGSIFAITGGSVEAITGGSGAATVRGSFQIWHGESLVLSGPIESIDRASGMFVSVGQNVLASRGALDSLSVGDFVSVKGTIAGAGWIYADDIAISREMYVPGATEVFVTGIPSSVDWNLGTARIGGLTVDYTPSLGGSGFGGLGSAITVIGTQPAPGGVMLSDRILDQTKLILGY